jgi:hypothetical protein
MGNIFDFSAQPKEIRIIYVKNHEKVYPINWPFSYDDLLLELCALFPYMQALTLEELRFKDAGDDPVTVCTQSTFSALAPKHKKLAPTVDLYYVSLDECVVR